MQSEYILKIILNKIKNEFIKQIRFNKGNGK